MKANKYQLRKILGHLLEADAALDKARMSLIIAKGEIAGADNSEEAEIIRAEIDGMLHLLYADDANILAHGNGDMLCIPDTIAGIVENFEEVVS